MVVSLLHAKIGLYHGLPVRRRGGKGQSVGGVVTISSEDATQTSVIRRGWHLTAAPSRLSRRHSVLITKDGAHAPGWRWQRLRFTASVWMLVVRHSMLQVCYVGSVRE
jgi:hypothetical protein